MVKLLTVCISKKVFRGVVKGRECVRNLDLRVQVHPGELWVPKQQVYIVLEASKAGFTLVVLQ